jgi:hypothetical protein
VAELPRRVDDKGKRAFGALIRRLQIVWPKGTRRLSVALLPDCDDDDLALPVTPLDLARRPVRLIEYLRRDRAMMSRREAAYAQKPAVVPRSRSVYSSRSMVSKSLVKESRAINPNASEIISETNRKTAVARKRVV